VSPIHRGLVAVAVAVLLALAPTAAQAKKPGQQVNVTIDQQGLEGRPQAVASAWMGYGLGRANWLSEHVVGKKDVPQPYRRSFEEEVAGRETLAKIWSELKQSDPEARDDYLDALAHVLESGFLREYVWVYLKGPEWQAAPPGLRLGEFATWRESNLAAHEVETFADVTVVGKPK
jgi:hypothetical protein